MQKIASADKYLSVIRNYFGESPTSARERSSRMTADDGHELAARLKEPYVWEEAPRKPGQLRPAALWFKDALPLLFWVHEVAVPDYVMPALDGALSLDGFGESISFGWNTVAVGNFVAELLEMEPFLHSGLIRLADPRVNNVAEPGVWQAVDPLATDAFDDALGFGFASMKGEDGPTTHDLAANQVGEAIIRTVRAGRNVDLWIGDPEYREYARIALRRLRRLHGRAPILPEQHDDDTMVNLISVSIPGIESVSARDMVSIRNHEQRFEDWRQDLTRAFRQLPDGRLVSHADILARRQRSGTTRYLARLIRTAFGKLVGPLWANQLVSTARTGRLAGAPADRAWSGPGRRRRPYQVPGRDVSLMRAVKSCQAAWVMARIEPSGSAELRSTIASSCAAASMQAPPSHQLLLRHSELLPRPDAKTPSPKR